MNLFALTVNSNINSVNKLTARGTFKNTKYNFLLLKDSKRMEHYVKM